MKIATMLVMPHYESGDDSMADTDPKDEINFITDSKEVPKPELL
jgi:hypothetical protein